MYSITRRLHLSIKYITDAGIWTTKLGLRSVSMCVVCGDRQTVAMDAKLAFHKMWKPSTHFLEKPSNQLSTCYWVNKQRHFSVAFSTLWVYSVCVHMMTGSGKGTVLKPHVNMYVYVYHSKNNQHSLCC